MHRSLSWAALALLLAATLVGAVTFDRRSWPGLVGDEATYLMQAQSLAWDFDLRYSRADFDRFVEQWGVKPDGLILQSADGGRTLTYSKPASYAAWIAPFLRLSPTRGASIANALLLALAAVAAARTLSRRLGPAAPLWVAAWVFASVAFAYVFWVHSDLFLMCLTALALALAYGAPREADSPETAGRAILRWLVVGALLGLVLMSRPFYGALLLPAALAVPRSRRVSGIASLVLGAGLIVLGSGLANLADADALTPYSGHRQSFDSSTGFPGVDLPAGSWAAQIAQRGDHTWRAQVNFDRTQTAWNVLYFFVGRHVGILPYFLPLLLGLAAFRRGEGRGLLILAALAAAFCFLLIRPFNFYGGGGALANRYFLPLYPAFWFAGGRPASGAIRASWAVLVALLALPFLLPLWMHPRDYLTTPEGGYSYVSHSAQRFLPYETTLSHLKPAGQEDFVHNAMWIKLLTPSLRPRKEGGTATALEMNDSGTGQLLIGSPAPLDGVELDVSPPLPQRLDIFGAERVTAVPLPGGVAGNLLHFTHPRAVHRMWWTDDPYYLYQLRLAAPKGRGFTFTLRPVAKHSSMPPPPAPLRGGPSLPQPPLSQPPPLPPGERGLKHSGDEGSWLFSLFSRRTGGRLGEEGRGDEGPTPQPAI
ncbi:MAG: hypothetical protein WAM82_00605 [Thermoanaerobaculia bacterium]